MNRLSFLWWRWATWLVLTLFTWGACGSEDVQVEEYLPRVVILDSYHPGETWSDGELLGLLSTLQRQFPNLLPPVEYLDAKRFTGVEYLSLFKDYLVRKYQSRPIDLLIVLDNPALDLVLKYRSELFPGIATVFAGINGFHPKLLEGQDKITGVAEVQDIKGTLKLALALHPGAKQVLAIHDHTVSGLAVRREMEAILPAFVGKVNISFTPDIPFSELERQLRGLSEDTLVLLLTYVTDASGRVFSREESTRLISSASPAPVYAMHATRLGHGIVGGMLLDSEEHGTQAGEIATRVMAGEHASRIPVAGSRSRPMFDEYQLRRFGISPGALPANSIIINQPVSFFVEHPGLMLVTSAVSILLGLIVVVLVAATMRARRAEAALRESEARLKLALAASRTGVWEWDVRTDAIVWSSECFEIVGLESFTGTLESFTDLVHPEDAARVITAVKGAVADRTVYKTEFRTTHPNGALHWLSILGRAVYDESGEPLRMIGTVTDITERKAVETALARERALLKSLIDSVPDMIFYKDTQSVYLGCNRAFTGYFAHPEEEIIGHTDFEFVDADTARFFREQDRLMLESGQPRRNEEWVTYPGGERVLLETLKTPYYGPDGELLGLIGVSRDITARHEAEEQRRLAAVAFETSEAIFITDRDGNIQRVNRSFTRLTGYTAEEVLGKNPRILKSGRHGTEFYAALWQSLQKEHRWTGEIWNRHKSGEIHPQWQSIATVTDEQGEITHFVATFFDLSEQKAAEESIHRLAYYDPLTDLPNRQLLLDRLASAQAVARRDGHFGAVLLLDLDDFKHVNDARGHETGDQILRDVARRLTQSLREEDTVARVGGDEFVVLLASLAGSEDDAARLARGVAEKIHRTLSVPFRLEESEYILGASIGVTLFPKDSEGATDLLKQSDTAMHQAKAQGRNSVRFFQAAMQAQVEARFILEGELRRAIGREELRLYFQPQVDRQSNMVGAEALLRWQHPDRGLVSPATFIPLAEETGLIVALGEWALLETCRLLVRLTSSGNPLRLAVNVSPLQFRQPHFVTHVRAILTATGADPSLLTLEVTEGAVIEDIGGTIAKLSELKALGIHLSIDDFGTGYSSLAYLKRLPIDELKIDRTFVQDIPEDHNGVALVEAILAVAQHLSLSVVAEGVETAEQAAFLQHRGCTTYQGYLFGRPTPMESFIHTAQGAG